MGDTEIVSRELVEDEEVGRARNETVSGGVKVIKEDRFGDALVIEDYEIGMESLKGKGKEIELLPCGKYAVDNEALEFAEAAVHLEEDESRKARDSHSFQTVQFKLPGTYCDHCGTLIWGMTGKQGLKCEVCNYVCHIDCEKKLAKRCRGYKNKVVDEEEPEEIKNIDKDKDFYDDLKNIGCHQFYPKMTRRTYCNVCRQAVNLVGKQGLRCSICRYVVHSGCAKDAERNCPIPYHVPDTRKEKIPKHHWIEGNIESGGICIYCAKTVSGGSGMTNFQCFWCKGLIHNGCKDKHHQCDMGQHHNLKLPPHVFQRNKNEDDPHKWLVDLSMVPEDHSKRPLCVLINRMSGARQGAGVIRQLSRLLNPMQIVDIGKGGPLFGIEMFSPLCQLPGSFCILGCGGDGTIGWICEELDKLNLPYEERPCIVPLPIGTGNDLSRVLGWGPGYEGEDLSKILDDIEVAKVVYMDRWKIKTFMTEENIKSGKKNTQEPKREKRKKQRSKSNKQQAFARRWERALTLSKEKIIVTRNFAKGKLAKSNDNKPVQNRKGSAKRKRNRSKKEKRSRKKEAMSDDEGERRKTVLEEEEEKAAEYEREQEMKGESRAQITNESENITESSNVSPLTRHKASFLMKSLSMPAIGSGIKLPDKENGDEEEAAPSPVENEPQEADEAETKEDKDDEAQPAKKEDKGKEKEKEKEDDEKEKPEKEKEKEKEDDLPVLSDAEVPEEFKDMQLVAEKIYNNYFSVGVDAKVALDFHIARESNPENFKSRNYNKFKYFQYGAVSVLGGCKDLNQKISVVVDGKEVKIPNSVEGIVALNLTSYASGTNPWKTSRPVQEWSEQRFDDGLIEVVGVNGTIHLAQIRTGLSTGVQLGQGKRVIFTLKEALPVQADGEPWLQHPAVMEVCLHNKTKMLQRPQQQTVLGQMLSPSSWFKKGRKKPEKKNNKENEFGIDDEGDHDHDTPREEPKKHQNKDEGEKEKKAD